MKTLLFIAHTPSDNTQKLSHHARLAIAEYTENLRLIYKSPEQVMPEDGYGCDGIILGSLENIGYMSGMTKDMFDRCYNHWLEKQNGLPAFIYIRAGLDGTATKRALSQIATGLKWRISIPPLILKGRFDEAFIPQLEEQVAGFAAGLETGIF